MGTLSTAITRARIRARDTAKTLLTDTQLIELANGAVETIYAQLVEIRSSLVFATDTLTTEAGTDEYTANFRFTAVSLAHIAGDPTPLDAVAPEAAAAQAGAAPGRPAAFYLKPQRRVGFLPVPNDAYPVVFYYQQPLPALTKPEDTLPFDGIWDRVIEDMLTVDMLGTNERDTTYAAGLLAVNWTGAMNKTYARGVMRRRVRRPAMFAAEGV